MIALLALVLLTEDPKIERQKDCLRIYDSSHDKLGTEILKINWRYLEQTDTCEVVYLAPEFLEPICEDNDLSKLKRIESTFGKVDCENYSIVKSY